ncbi:unnamed protein product [Diplocarpon coronariae]
MDQTSSPDSRREAAWELVDACHNTGFVCVKNYAKLMAQGVSLPGFQDFYLGFHAECWKTSTIILQALSLGLDLPSDDFLLRFRSETEQLNLKDYSPVSESKVSSREVNRLCAYTDFDLFTLPSDSIADFLTSTVHRIHLPSFDESCAGESHNRTWTLLQCLDYPFTAGQRQKHELKSFGVLC